MNDEECAEHLLPGEEDSTISSSRSLRTLFKRPAWAIRGFPVPSTALVLSILMNLFFTLLLIYIIIIHSGSTGITSLRLPTPILPTSPYSGLALDRPTIYHHHTPYWGANATLADTLWDGIDTDPMVIALTDAYAFAHNLSLSSRWPWDRRKGRYFLKMFHQLHCLKYVRRHLVDLKRTNSSGLDSVHAHHCLDLLRKDVLCYGDDTPMPTNDMHTAIGDGQVLMCRDYEKMVAWAQAPERNACHRSLDEYRQIKHPIERYAFCEEDSQYYEVMKGYFEEHGHVNPYDI